MNKHKKLEIIKKIQQLPESEQGTVACMFEILERIDSATKLPYIIGLWVGILGMVIFPAVVDLSQTGHFIKYCLGIMVAAACFLAATMAAKLLYFNRMRDQAITYLGYTSIDEMSRLAMIKLQELDPATKLLIDQYRRMRR